MYATVMHGPGDVRYEQVEDPKIPKPTDAIIQLSATWLWIEMMRGSGRRWSDPVHAGVSRRRVQSSVRPFASRACASLRHFCGSSGRAAKASSPERFSRSR